MSYDENQASLDGAETGSVACVPIPTQTTQGAMNVESSPPESLNERAQHLLRVLVQSYIREGQPVGSRPLSRDSGLSLSSATIRNVMADLEDLGFVSSPHTSAGRVPTDKGYRVFVDTLLKLKPLHHEEIENIERRLKSDEVNGRSLVQTVSQMLS